MKSKSICRPIGWAAAIAALLICHVGVTQSVVEYSTRFTPTEGINADDIGYSIDVDNNLLVLGAVGRDESASGSGAAYVYEDVNSTWTLRVKLAPASLGSLDRFGEQVAVSGSRIAVSAQNYVGTNNHGGGVWTYTYAGGEATFEDRVIPDDNVRYDLYGRAMDLEGDVLVVGAPGHDENGPGSGAVYIFEHDGAQWVQTAKLQPANGSGFRSFGAALDLAGSTLLVGAPDTLIDGGTVGAAFVYQKIGGNWSEVARLNSPAVTAGDRFGRHVWLAGNHAAVGTEVGYLGQLYSGYVDLFQLGSWQYLDRLAPDEPQPNMAFGTALAARGDLIVVGAPSVSAADGSRTGGAFFFRKTGSTWKQVRQLEPDDAWNTLAFGNDLRFEDDRLFVADMDANLNGTASGGVFVFNLVAGLSSPTDIQLSGGVVGENQPVGRVAGELSTTDPEPEDHHFYELVDGSGATDNGLFRIGGPNGNQLLTATVLDAETQGMRSVRIRSTDVGGNFIERVFVVSVTDVEDGTIPGISLDGLSLPYTGEPRLPTIITSPTNVAAAVIFAGRDSPPVEPGTYPFTVHVIEPGYSGSATGQLVIGPGVQTLPFAALDNLRVDQPVLALPAVTDAGLPIIWELLAGPATLDGSLLRLNGQPGTIQLRASQAGDERWKPAGPLLLAVTALAPAARQDVTEFSFFTPTNLTANSYFTAELDFDGQTLVAQASNHRASGAGSGSVFVYAQVDDFNWTRQAELNAPSGSSGGFGNQVAVDGDSLLIGDYFNDDRGNNQGVGLVYERVNGEWSAATNLYAQTLTNVANYGRLAEMRGDLLVLGTTSGTPYPTQDGLVEVYRKVSGSWLFEASLRPEFDHAPADILAYQPAITDDTVLVPCLWHGRDGTSRYEVAVFHHQDGSWRHTGVLERRHVQANDQFGSSIAVHDDRAIVAAPGYDAGDTIQSSGAVFIYRRVHGRWVEEAFIPSPQPAASKPFGTAVAISDRYAVVGQSAANDFASSAGRIVVFERHDGFWVQRASISAQDVQTSDAFGHRLALSGNRLIVGARYADVQAGNTGKAYYFKLDDERQNQRIGFDFLPEFNVGETVTLNVTSSSGLPVTLVSSAPELLSITGQTLSALSPGPLEVQATQGGDATYLAAPPVIRPTFVHSDAAVFEDKFFAQDNVYVRFLGRSFSTLFESGRVFAQASRSNGISISMDPFSGQYFTNVTYEDRIYVHERDGLGEWSQTGVITRPPEMRGNAAFGSDLVSDGDYLYLSSATDYTNSTQSGSVVIFQRVGTNWTYVRHLYAPTPVWGEYYGRSIDLGDDWLFVSAESTTEAGSRAGSVYVYRRVSGTAWNFHAQLKASDGAANENFGYQVQYDQGRLFVLSRSKIYVFEHDEQAGWFESGTVVPDAGWSWYLPDFDASGDRVLVGLSGSNSTVGAGVIFERQPDGSWTETSRLLPDDLATSVGFGAKVQLQGRVALVATSTQDSFKNSSSPTIFIFFQTDGGGWVRHARIANRRGNTGDRFGEAIWLGDGEFMTSAYADDEAAESAGALYSYRLANYPDFLGSGDLYLNNLSVFEAQPAGTQIGLIQNRLAAADDPTLSYSLVAGDGDRDNARVQVVGDRLLTTEVLDYESQTNLLVRLQSSYGTNQTVAETYEIRIKDLVPGVQLTKRTVPEREASGTLVGRLAVLDPPTEYTLALVSGAGDTDNSRFQIAGLDLLTAAELNYDQQATHSIRVALSSGGVVLAERIFEITVEDVNSPPYQIELSNNSVFEHQAGGTVVGRITGSDLDAPDHPDALQYSIVGLGGLPPTGNYYINGRDLVTSRRLTREDVGPLGLQVLRIRATDTKGAFYEFSFVIYIDELPPYGPYVSIDRVLPPLSSNDGTFLFGDVVAMDGDLAAIGTTTFGREVITFHQLNRSGTFPTWEQIQRVDINVAATDAFLTSMDLERDRLIVGLPTGDVALYRFSSGTWAEELFLSDVGTRVISVDLERDRFTVGTDSQAHLYEWNATTETWDLTQQHNVAFPQVELEGNYWVVNDQVRHRDEGGSNAWGVRYTLSEGLPDVDRRAALANDFLAMSGERIALGGLEEEVRVFDLLGETPGLVAPEKVITQKPVTVGQSLFGTGVDLDGEILAVATLQKGIQIFGRNIGGPGNWGLSGSLKDPQNDFIYGGAVAVSGDYFLAGSGQDSPLTQLRFFQPDLGGNRIPTAIAINNTNLVENGTSGQYVGYLSLVDSDGVEAIEVLVPNATPGIAFDNLSGSFFVTDDVPAGFISFELVQGDGATDNPAFEIVGGNELVSKGPFDYETQNRYSIRIRGLDGRGGSVEQIVVFSVQDANEPPTDIVLSSTTVDENRPAGELVAILSTIDADGGPDYVYTLVQTPASTNFHLVGNELRTLAPIDFEQVPGETLRIRVNDGKGGLLTKPVVIQINDLNEPITGLTLDNNTLREDSPIGTAVGRFQVADADEFDTYSFEFVATNTFPGSAYFRINASGWLASTRVFDSDPPANDVSEMIRVAVEDAGGNRFTNTFTITIQPVNDPPADLALSSLEVPENAPLDTVVGAFSVTDVDGGPDYTYTLVPGSGSTDNEKFVIANNQLVLRQALDHEVRPRLFVRVNVNDGHDNNVEKGFQIEVLDRNDAPAGITPLARALDENLAGETLVAALVTSDQDAGQSHVYQILSGDPAGLFKIAAGTTSLVTTGPLNFESSASHVLTLRSTDNGTPALSVTNEFTVTVQDVNDAPHDIVMTAGGDWDENNVVGQQLARFEGRDEDAGDELTLSLQMVNGNPPGNDLQLSAAGILTAEASFNYETGPTNGVFALTIRAEDKAGSILDQVMTVTVNDINDAPSEIRLSALTVKEEQPVGTIITGLTVIDEDRPDDQLVVRLVAGEGGEENDFVQVSSGQLVTATRLDYERLPQLRLRLQADDGRGGLLTTNVVIAIEDIVEPPIPEIISRPPSQGQVGQLFTHQLQATFAPTNYLATGLPSGVVLNPVNGLLAGAPNAPGTYEITLRADNETHEGWLYTYSFEVLPPPPIIVSGARTSGRVGEAFRFQLIARFADVHAATGLPPGLGLDAVSGLISGTPTTSGTFAVAIAATNTTGFSSQALTIQIAPDVSLSTLSSPSLLLGKQGQLFNYVITGSENPTGTVVSDLPDGLFNPSPFTLAGTPAAFGDFEIQVRLINAAGTSDPFTLKLKLQPADDLPEIVSLSIAPGRVGESLRFQLMADVPVARYALTGDLPPGLTFDGPSGVIEGVPSADGEFSVQVAGVLGDSRMGRPSPLRLRIAPAPDAPVILGPLRIAVTNGVPFSSTVVSDPPADQIQTVRALDGVNVSAAGLITGATSGIGSSELVVQAIRNGQTGPERRIEIFASPHPEAPVVIAGQEAEVRLGESFTAAILTSGDPDEFIVAELPPGIQVDPTNGVLFGIPLTLGRHELQVQAANAFGPGLPEAVTLSVIPAAAAPEILGPRAIRLKLGQTASGRIALVDANQTVRFQAADLPPGIELRATTGELVGKPLAPGLFEATVWAVGDAGQSDDFKVQIRVEANTEVPRIASAATANGEQFQPFDYQIVASNGPITVYAMDPVPEGLNFDPATGHLSGTPAQPLSQRVLVQAVNAAGTSEPMVLLITIRPSQTVPVLVNPYFYSYVGRTFTYELKASALPSYSLTQPLPAGYGFGATGLPPGLVLDSQTGLLSGVPEVVGDHAVEVWAFNPEGEGPRWRGNFRILPPYNTFPRIIHEPAMLFRQGVPRDIEFRANGRAASFWDLSVYASTRLFDSFNRRSGDGRYRLDPVTAGAGSLSVRAYYYYTYLSWSGWRSGYGVASARVPTEVIPADLTTIPVITSPRLLEGRVGENFSFQPTASKNPTQWRVTWITYAPGIGQNRTTGLLSGIPRTAGTFDLRIFAINEFGESLGQTVTINVAPAVATPVFLQGVGLNTSTTDSSPAPPGYLAVLDAQVGADFSYALRASNDPERYEATGLPEGLVLNPNTGALSGVPTTPGPYDVTLTALNANGAGTSALIRIDVQATANAPVILSPQEIQLMAGSPATNRFVASNNAESLILAEVPTSLITAVDGLDLVITTDEPGIYAIRLSAAATNGVGYPRSFAVLASPAPGAPAFVGGTNLNGQVGADFAHTLSATNHVDHWEGRNLPPGLSLDPLTGALQGQPLARGCFEADFRPVNDSGFGYWQKVLFVIAAADGTSVITSVRQYSLQPGTPVQITFAASEDPVSYEASGLPDGLQLNASTGELTGNTSQGSVTFQLWANNAVGAGDPVTIVIATGETSAQRSWQVEFFGADADDPTKEATVWGDLADPDGDNWVNLLEFVMGLNPLQSDPDQGPRLFFRAGAPVIQLRRRIGLQDHTFRLERSSQLAQWSEVAELNEVIIATDGMAEIVEWSPPFSADQSFYRIMILNNAGTSTGNAQ